MSKQSELLGVLDAMKMENSRTESAITWAGERIKQLESLLWQQEDLITTLQCGIASVRELIDNSRGVAGLHLNGDVAEWCSLETGGCFEEWLVEFNDAEKAVDWEAHHHAIQQKQQGDAPCSIQKT